MAASRSTRAAVLAMALRKAMAALGAGFERQWMTAKLARGSVGIVLLDQYGDVPHQNSQLEYSCYMNRNFLTPKGGLHFLSARGAQ